MVVPNRVPLDQGAAFVKEKSAWIERTLQRIQRQNPHIQFQKQAKELLGTKGRRFQPCAHMRLEHFNQFYGFTWKQISIKIHLLAGKLL